MHMTKKREKHTVISKNRLLAFGVSGVLALGLAACGDDTESGGEVESEAQDLTGQIAIDGSSTVQPFAEAAAELFAESNPEVDISVGAAGTGGGFERFCAGETQISNASRPIDEEEEVPICEKEGIEYTEVQVANDGLSVVTNPALEISCLTVDQLEQLWSDDSISNYSDLGEDAETGEPLPDVDISLYGPGTDSGTFDYFTDVINGEEGKSRSDYQASEDDNQLVTGVAGDEAGMGYFGFSYYEQSADQLNLVSVDEGSGCVEPNAETIQDGSYAPLSRPLFMYPSNEALGDPAVSGFMQFIVDNYVPIAEAALYIPMDEVQAEEASSAVEDAAG
jgi:phosphate transport system substrate-binding protein